MGGFTRKEAYDLTRDARAEEMKERFFGDSEPPELRVIREMVLVQNMADALIAIVGTPWRGCEYEGRLECPHCSAAMTNEPEDYGHFTCCPWLTAARALGVA
ncbi:MAG TPA: hypothetical protein VEA41_02205 [Salinarimonas sp.]|nr:hypothetical protein [Salinarimonas sp.]